MKLAIVMAITALAVSPMTFASGFGFGAGGFASGAYGTASSVSNGNVVAGSQVVGNGLSIQGSFAQSAGSAGVQGSINPTGATISTNTVQDAVVASGGIAIGPGVQLRNSNGNILNGTTGFASSENHAEGEAGFAAGMIGLGVGFGGFGNFGGSQ